MRKASRELEASKATAEEQRVVVIVLNDRKRVSCDDVPLWELGREYIDHETSLSRTEMGEDLCSDIVAARVDWSAERDVGFHRVEPGVSQPYAWSLAAKPMPATFVPAQIHGHAAALHTDASAMLRGLGERRVESSCSPLPTACEGKHLVRLAKRARGNCTFP